MIETKFKIGDKIIYHRQKGEIVGISSTIIVILQDDGTEWHIWHITNDEPILMLDKEYYRNEKLKSLGIK